MAGPLIPDDPGLLSSIGKYLGRFAQVPLNLLSGDVGGAFRQGADILGDTVDAALPGDWVPEFSRPEDTKRPSAMLGIDPSDSLLAGAVDFTGETLLNPLTYLTAGGSTAAGLAGKSALKLGVPFTKAAAEIPGSAQALGAIGGAAKQAYGALPEAVQQGVQKGILGAKSTMGWLKAAPENQAILDAAENAKSVASQSAGAGAEQALQGLTDPEATELFRVIGNYRRTGEGPGDMVSELLPGSEAVNAPYRLADELASRQGPAPSSVSPIFRPDDYLQVKDTRLIQPVDDLGREVGVTGVAVPNLTGDVLETVTKDPSRMSDLVFGPQYANAASERTLDQAYPLIPTDPRYASGIDVANQALLAPGSGMRGVKTYGGAAEERRALPKLEGAPRERVDADPLTGAVSREPVVPRKQPEIPTSNTEALNSLMGGAPASVAKVTAENAPRATAPMVKLEDQLAQWNSRIDSLGKSPEETARLKEYAQKYLGYVHNDFVQKVKDFGALEQGIGDDVLTMIPQDYAHRRFTSLTPEEDLKLIGSQPNSLKSRVLKENQNLRDFLNSAEGKKTALEENLITGTAGLASQAGRIAQRSAIAKGLLKDKFVSLADEGTRGSVSDAIKAMESADPEGARLFEAAWNGIGERGPVMQMLANANAIFKPAAVYGLAFPRVGGIMKNLLSFPVQIGLGGEGKIAAQQVLRTPATIRNALQEGVHSAFNFQIPKDQLAQGLDLIEQAYKQSGGRAKNVGEFLRANGRPELASAVDNGVIDGFVSKESIENNIRDSGWGRKILSSLGTPRAKQDRIFDVIDAPAKAFQGAEQYARLATFLDLSKSMPEAQAAAKTKELLYNYDIKSGANRTLRDIIPFAAYQTNAIRQSAQFLSKNPSAAVALGNLSSTDPSEQYGWMSGKTNIPIGTSGTGDRQYLTGIGLPTEALNSIPNISGNLADTGQELRDNLLGSAQPLVKTAYSLLTGTDPRFGSAYGSYDKLPGNIQGGDVGRAYNQIAGTGLIQPLSTPIQQIGQLIDDRTSVGDKALNFLTGTRTVNVDQDRAMTQRLQEFLKNNPGVSSFQSFYQQDKDPETQALIKALAEAKKRSKEKRKAQESAP